MSEQNNSSKPLGGEKIDKKIMENPLMGSLMVPIAIVLVGALVIFGVTKMISQDHSYKDLVREMKSKTFGNKWVAALELSKIISAKKIPDSDIPWLVTNLEEIYKNTIDHRTRDFVVVALGSLGNERGLKVLDMALEDRDPDVRFHAIVALASMPKTIVYDWSKVLKYLESDDHAAVQAATLALATHKVREAAPVFESLLSSDHGRGVRYAAATGLIYFQNEKALPTLKEILMIDVKSEGQKLSSDQVRGLKLNVLLTLKNNPWEKMTPMVEEYLNKFSDDLKVSAIAKEVLNLLKK